MNIETAKQIKIFEYLASLGHHPIEAESNSKWLKYYSPFRKERNPSFEVKVTGDYYKDFGRDEKAGDIINLVSRLHNTDTAGALKILEAFSQQNQPPKPMFFVHEHKINKAMSKPPAPTYHQTTINDPKLMVYLAIDRAIPAKVWQDVPELSQIIYCPMGARYKVSYSNIAFQNDLGGFELRNREFKGTIGQKAITTIQGQENNKLILFEGFIDYLSFIAHYGRKPHSKTIVLNSLTNLHKVSPTLAQYEKIHLFLDNDEAGNKAAAQIMKEHPQAVDWSKVIYPEDDDLNMFIWHKPEHLKLVQQYESSY
ncbi:MAG: toprim domain-containing protein [Bacteroidales bacterium]|nr:toprim domain-containing protein [Bacteroidales bacterium]